MRNSKTIPSKPISHWLCFFKFKDSEVKGRKSVSSGWQNCFSEVKKTSEPPNQNPTKTIDVSKSYFEGKITCQKETTLLLAEQHLFQPVSLYVVCECNFLWAVQRFSQTPFWISVEGFESRTWFRSFGCCSGILESWIWPTEYEVLRGNMLG